MDVFDGEDARTLVGFEIGSVKKVAVTVSLGTSVPTDGDDLTGVSLGILVPTDEDEVTGGNPKMEPFV